MFTFAKVIYLTIFVKNLIIMKYLGILVLSLIVLSSCKKDYTCTCEEKDVYMGNVETFQYTYSVKEANKTQAQAACNEATIRFEESQNDYYEVSCELD